MKRMQSAWRSAGHVCAAVAATLWVGIAHALDPFTVRDIQVEGLQRVEPGTIFASIPVHVGDTYNDEKGAATIRALFDLGLFQDVRLEANGDVLVVVVQERPIVADVRFVGVKEFDADALKKSLRDVGLTEGRSFDKALADRAEQELKQQYISRSLYGAKVVTTVTPVDRNRVNLTFTVTEGEPARIKKINIVGNHAYDEKKLLDLIDLRPTGWMSWYTKSDRYARTKLNADIETLRSYYLSHGYLEFSVDSTQVAISPNKQDIYITLNITEGNCYTVSGVKLEGNYLGKDDTFKSLVTIKPGKVYNADEVAQTTKAFRDYYGTFGFAFAKVEAIPEINHEKNQVNIVIQSDPLRRAYVRRINISGNNRTRDEVIRREFRQMESSWFDSDKIRVSRDRVDRLGYFTDVSVETAEVPSAPDEVDLNVGVTEKPTGNLLIGAGFSSAEKLSLQFSISQDNVFGSGNSLGLNINTSKYNRQLLVDTTNPYFTDDGISRTWSLYHQTNMPYADQGGNYSLVTSGASVRFGVPFTENDTVFFGVGLEHLTIKPGTNLPAAYQAYADVYGYGSSAVPLTVGWARDTRDSALAPNSGRYQRLNSEWGAAGDARYVRTNYQYQQYIPLNKQYTVSLNANIGWGKALGGRLYPVFKNYFGGGLGSVRGFEQGTLGPKDAVTGDAIGGTKEVNLNAEFLTPFPGAGNDKTLRLFGFLDTGNVFGPDEPFSTSEFRASYGVGLSWVSPVGPLRFAYAIPFRKFSGDRIQRIQFQIGNSF